MNTEAPSNPSLSAQSAIKTISTVADSQEKSFLEMMDSIPCCTDIEFEPPKFNFIFKPIEFD
jgi:hypothetical protein